MANVEAVSGIPVRRRVGASQSSERNVFDVAVVGGGPVGLSLALDLGRKGHSVVVLNKLDFVAAGSKAICFAKRSLDIWNRMGIGEAIEEVGIDWNVGKVFWGDRPDPIYQFDMLPQKHQQMPGFVNVQQYHVEEILIEAVGKLPNIELRWGHEVTGISQDAAAADLEVRSGEDAYIVRCDWVCACDGSRSPIRTMLGLDFEGRVFEDNFLIADIRIAEQRPAERWFWFDPPFNPGQSALLHKQPDDVWRLDFQLGWNIDREACIRPENVAPFVRGMLGQDAKFEPEWYSVYTFQCRRMARFVHDRVIFAGDSAHLVSPFGARGCNGGVADADNLAWKLDYILKGKAPPSLLEAYNYEAVMTADVNIQASSRSTDFMTPKTATSRAFRDAVLELAGEHDFARPFVNSGRLSVAVSFPGSPIVTPDDRVTTWMGVPPGSPAVDAPTGDGWLLEQFGDDFVLLTNGVERMCADVPGWSKDDLRHIRLEDIGDPEGLIGSRYDLQPGTIYLIRPDQYVAARWRRLDAEKIQQALDRAKGII